MRHDALGGEGGTMSVTTSLEIPVLPVRADVRIAGPPYFLSDLY